MFAYGPPTSGAMSDWPRSSFRTGITPAFCGGCSPTARAKTSSRPFLPVIRSAGCAACSRNMGLTTAFMAMTRSRPTSLFPAWRSPWEQPFVDLRPRHLGRRYSVLRGKANLASRNAITIGLEMRLHERLIKGTALNLIAMSFNQGSTFVASIFVARILKKEAFGEYAMVYTTLLTAVTLSQLAMGYTSSKYVAEYRSVNPKRAGSILG